MGDIPIEFLDKDGKLLLSINICHNATVINIDTGYNKKNTSVYVGTYTKPMGLCYNLNLRTSAYFDHCRTKMLYCIRNLEKLVLLEEIIVLRDVSKVISPVESWPGFETFGRNLKTFHGPTQDGRYSQIVSPDTNLTFNTSFCGMSNSTFWCDCASKLRKRALSDLFQIERLVKIVMPLKSLRLPNYILLWIIDWLPHFADVKEWKKIDFISKINDYKL